MGLARSHERCIALALVFAAATNSPEVAEALVSTFGLHVDADSASRAAAIATAAAKSTQVTGLTPRS